MQHSLLKCAGVLSLLFFSALYLGTYAVAEPVFKIQDGRAIAVVNHDRTVKICKNFTPNCQSTKHANRLWIFDGQIENRDMLILMSEQESGRFFVDDVTVLEAEPFISKEMQFLLWGALITLISAISTQFTNDWLKVRATDRIAFEDWKDNCLSSLKTWLADGGKEKLVFPRADTGSMNYRDRVSASRNLLQATYDNETLKSSSNQKIFEALTEQISRFK